MADDILERLWEWQDHKDGGDKSYALYLTLGDAADETERLREDLNTTQELLARCYRMAVGHGPNFNVFDNWEEAISAYEREARHG